MIESNSPIQSFTNPYNQSFNHSLTQSCSHLIILSLNILLKHKDIYIFEDIFTFNFNLFKDF